MSCCSIPARIAHFSIGETVRCEVPGWGYPRAVNSSTLLVVGSGPAGIGAAEAFREQDPHGTVCVLTDDPYMPYARPPLSKEYPRGESSDVALHPTQWFDARRIEVINTRR